MPQASRSLKLFAALVALGLMSAPARAEVWDFKFDKWIADEYSIAGVGQVISAAQATGVPVFVVSASIVVTAWVAIAGPPGGPTFCNVHPEICRVAQFPDPAIHGYGGPVTVTSASWRPGGNLLLFTSEAYPGAVGVSTSELSLVVPGPLAGTGLPALAGLLGAWFFRRRPYGSAL